MEFQIIKMLKNFPHVDKQPPSPGMFSFPSQSAKLLSWSTNLQNSQKKLIDSSLSDGGKLKNGSDGNNLSASRKGHQNNLGLICIV